MQPPLSSGMIFVASPAWVVRAINNFTCFLALRLLAGFICFDSKLPDELAQA